MNSLACQISWKACEAIGAAASDGLGWGINYASSWFRWKTTHCLLVQGSSRKYQEHSAERITLHFLAVNKSKTKSWYNDLSTSRPKERYGGKGVFRRTLNSSTSSLLLSNILDNIPTFSFTPNFYTKYKNKGSPEDTLESYCWIDQWFRQ